MATDTADTRIKTIISADSSDFESGLKRATSALQSAEGKFKSSSSNSSKAFESIGTSLTKLGSTFGVALSVGALVEFEKSVVDSAAKLTNLSNQTGVSVSVFSALQTTIENSGGSLDDFGEAIHKMNQVIGEASAGGKEAGDKFKQLGVDIKSLQGLTPEQQFYKLSTAISQLGSENDRTTASVAIFGKGIQTLQPLIEQGGQAISDFVTQQENLQTAVDPAAVARVNAFGEAMHSTAVIIKNESINALGEFLTYIDSLEDRLARFQREHGVTQKSIQEGTQQTIQSHGGDTIGASFGPTVAEQKATEAAAQAAYAAKASAAGFQTKATIGDAGVDLKSEYEDLNGTLADTKKLFDTTSADKAAASALQLSDAIGKIKDKSDQSLATAGMTELQAKLADVDFQADELAKKYHSTLTPAEEENIQKTKDNTSALYALQQQQAINTQLAGDLGNALTDAFEDSIVEGKKFSDILTSLAQQIEKAVLTAEIVTPIKNDIANAVKGTGSSSLFSAAAKSIGSIFGLAGGGDVNSGTPTLVGEKGPEIFTPRSQGMIIPNHAIGSGGGNVQVNVINNSNSSVSTSSKNTGSGPSIEVLIDQQVAKSISTRGSNISRALNARASRTTISR